MDLGATEGWKEKKKILVILAHPDDPEFFCGASIARWTQAGQQVHYCLLTRGEKGVQNNIRDPLELAKQREDEQRQAARELGVQDVRFMDFPDGYLQPTLDARKTVVKVLRETRPDIVVTSDPTNYFPRENRINHPDHRICGQIVVEAVFPACGNPMYFPELAQEGLSPHSIEELWLTLTTQGNFHIDVTEWWERRISALMKHTSQIADMAAFETNQRSRRTSDSTDDDPRYVDVFRRIRFT